MRLSGRMRKEGKFWLADTFSSRARIGRGEAPGIIHEKPNLGIDISW